ncbi:hypothetical protein GCM10008904_12950 [Paraclostridium ghonii]|uniref:DUF4363 family protein n=1 Tax=Paraclostridium ghonii TaxID=29358 RepID=A0ABU0N5V2_9FIRM|nr:DUF4363 family protein [Paeniclostridium ghonii]MCM0167467.1 DUF4363 family protein [Paeniclostridium ghonii]MDQ0558188.1 hypothetical protein [Paeniclostridium ghonii]
MKSIVFTVIWTIALVTFGLFISFKAEDFSINYTNKMDKLEVYVKNEDWDKCEKYTNEIEKNLKNESKQFFKFLNHCHLGDIELAFNVLSDGIYLKDVSICLEQIDIIKISLHRLIESEKHNLDHIL